MLASVAALLAGEGLRRGDEEGQDDEDKRGKNSGGTHDEGIR